jgi:steroid delta-isomerase-like uncharacterized protein
MVSQFSEAGKMMRLIATLVLVLAVPIAEAAQPVINHTDVDRWAMAWNSHDINRVMGLFAKDVRIDQPENPRPLDLDGTRKFFTMIFHAYPDFHVEVKQAVVEGLTAVSVEQVTGTWSGAFIDPATGKSTAGNNRKFDHPGVMVIQYSPNHKIKHVSIYWDQLVVDRQLGIAP